MKHKDFTIFILTHGRPNTIKTIATLKKSGYTGSFYLVVDNEDKSLNEYQQKFGLDIVKVFDKKAMADKIDEGNNFDNRKVIVHARNVCFDIAKELGITYFMQLDDDYTAFEYRYISTCGKKLKCIKINNFDTILDLYLDFFIKSNFSTIAFAQGGDFIGGVQNPYVIKRPLMRKCMNSFICSTKKPFQFVGSINEDVNTYTTLASRGVLFGTVPMISLVQAATQSQKKGMTDIYEKFGTYVKSFTSVMMFPSAVKVSVMHSINPRIHHLIKWKNTTPVIVSAKHKK